MNRISELRKRKGISQEKLASHLKVHQTAVSQWEKGRTMPDIETLITLSKFFETSVDYILGIEIEPIEIKIARQNAKKLYLEQDPPIEEIERQTKTNYGTFRSWISGYGDYFNQCLYLLANLFHCSVDLLLDREPKSLNTLYGIDDKETISDHEKILLNAYRRQPEMQEAVDRLLGIQKSNEVTTIGKVAAFGGGTKQVEYTEQEAKESDKARDQFHYELMSSFDDEDE